MAVVRKRIRSFICVIFSINALFACGNTHKPRLSLIASVYDGDEFINGFLQDIVQLQNFHTYELLLVNANSPGNEESVIRQFEKEYENIRYITLETDPGLYGVWNYAIQIAKASYITNTNIDDRRNHHFLEKQIAVLNREPAIDLVYSDYMVTYVPNENFEDNTFQWRSYQPEFDRSQMNKCIAGPGPMWRVSLHKKYGYFREDFYGAGDWEFWNRIVLQGAQFKKIEGCSILYYFNPVGLSTSEDHEKSAARLREEAFINGAYRFMWDSAEEDSPLLLIHLPIQERPEYFFELLDTLYIQLSGATRYRFLISCDIADISMNNAAVRKRLSWYPNLVVRFNDRQVSTTLFTDDLADSFFDLVLLLNSDSKGLAKSFDKKVVNQMMLSYPDLDGLFLYYTDEAGDQGSTYQVIGKVYFDRMLQEEPLRAVSIQQKIIS